MKRLAKIRLGALVALVAAALMVGAVTRADAACADTPFLGEICTFAFGYCPKGFVAAAGQLMSINDNQALFSLLGTNFGGNGVVTFGLPDLRGATVVGAGQGPSLPNIDVGQTGGNANTVSVVAAVPPDGVPVPVTQLPFLGLTHCLAVQGVFPSRN